MPRNRVNQRERLGQLGTAILTVLGTVAFISVALLAPNAIQMFTPPKTKRRRRPTGWDINRAVSTLTNRGYVMRERRRGKWVISLTPKGQRRLYDLTLVQQREALPKRWDGKWRLVFFDIPAEYGKLRNNVRRKLRELGFHQAQKSVYIYPHECPEVISP